MSVHAASDLRSRLDSYLGRHDLDLTDIFSYVDESFGDPVLVVAAGSVLADYGNQSSDLDIYVVVPGPVPSQLPVMSYPRDARIDVVFHDEATLVERHQEVVTVAWPPAMAAPVVFARRRKVLESLSRLGFGLCLSGTAEWKRWRATLPAQVSGWLRDWYAVDAVRKRLVARLLLPAKPRLAALRAGDALLAALERRAIAGGEAYFKWKWVGEKLIRLGDEEGYALFELATCLPSGSADYAGYVRRVDGVLADLLADVDTGAWRAYVEPAPGTTSVPFGDRTLVSRWGLRAVSLSAQSPAGAVHPWDLALDEPWHPDLTALLAEDMLWLGIRRPC